MVKGGLAWHLPTCTRGDLDPFSISAGPRQRLQTQFGQASSSQRLNVCLKLHTQGIMLSIDVGLVVYHCTFLSLRSHDSSRHVRNYLDHDLAEEKSHFAGSVFPPYGPSKHTNGNSAIRDSGYKHALRLYRDRSTDALRLEASVLKGEMEKYAPSEIFRSTSNYFCSTPIWTSFITHCITSPTWCRYSENSSTVYLADLRRHIFSSDYTPHVAANGEHFLDFELVQGRFAARWVVSPSS